MFKHILIPTDGSDLSRKAILYGVQLAKESGAKVTGLTVAEPYHLASADTVLIPIDEGAELKGLQGWQGPGWTAPDPGSRHYPEVRGGALIALFYLPAGRISYDFDPAS